MSRKPLSSLTAMNHLARWALVLLVAIVVWPATYLLGIGGVVLLDAICPEELMLSGHCLASWYEPAFYVLTLVCSAILAFSMVLLPAIVAPGHRARVSLVAYSLGAILAIYYQFWTGSLLLGHSFTAAAFGGFAVAISRSRWRRIAV